MLAPLIRAYERWHAGRDASRRAHPFAWGLEYLDMESRKERPLPRMVEHARRVMEDPERFYPDPGSPPVVSVSRDRDPDGALRVAFPSAVRAPESVTNRASLRLFEPESPGRRAMVVLPQWNAEPASHVTLCRGLAGRGVAAARLTLPYHDERAPAAEPRGDLAVSANLGRTLLSVRQAVSDVRRVRAWLERRGYDRVGVLGTSLGSCIAFLSLANDARFRVAVLHHVSSHFGDAVWRGVSTRHVRAELERGVSRAALRRAWAPISPIHFVHRIPPRSRSLLLIGRHDLTFPLDLSLLLRRAYRQHAVPHDAILMPWGHYTSGIFPLAAVLMVRVWRWLDGRL
ncbi:MAG: hypothetical protein R3199_09990 [Gemmatimonadota bacterium]|nr:hypothetical protein [Gemmatimonadota bacterium]